MVSMLAENVRWLVLAASNAAAYLVISLTRTAFPRVGQSPLSITEALTGPMLAPTQTTNDAAVGRGARAGWTDSAVAVH